MSKDRDLDNNDEYEEGDDVVYDDADLPSDATKKLRERLSKCVNEKQEYLDGWQRSQADFVNFKKRSDEEKKEFSKFVIEDFVVELLPVLDSFDLAMKDKKAWNAAPENWRKGIEYIYQQFLNTLNGRGVEQIDPVGEEFDTQRHDSVSEMSGEEGKIMEVVLKGYSLKGKLIRPASVKVGDGN